LDCSLLAIALLPGSTANYEACSCNTW